jgi:hypothetical protein
MIAWSSRRRAPGSMSYTRKSNTSNQGKISRNHCRSKPPRACRKSAQRSTKEKWPTCETTIRRCCLTCKNRPKRSGPSNANLNATNVSMSASIALKLRTRSCKRSCWNTTRPAVRRTSCWWAVCTSSGPNTENCLMRGARKPDFHCRCAATTKSSPRRCSRDSSRL